MQKQTIGKSAIQSSRLAYGNMRTLGTWNPKEVTDEKMQAAVAAHVAAYEAGFNHFDTADIYCANQCELALGNTLKQVSGMRDAVTVATKCGIRWKGDSAPDAPHRYDFSAGHIAWSCDNSLAHLQIEQIDLYYLHRPDVLMNPPEIAKAFEALHKAGKVAAFGVSNFTPTQVAMLQAHLPMPIVANQLEISLGKLDYFVDGTLDQAIERTITPLSWGPLSGGWLGAGKTLDPSDPKTPTRQAVLDELDAQAKAHGVSRTVLALAWLMKHPSGIIPIVGSSNPKHIQEAAKADEIEMTREQWYRLYLAARGAALP